MDKGERDFWQHHSLRFLEMAFRTDRMETVASPDGVGKRTGECGDTVEFFVLMEGDHVRRVSFQTNGCFNTVACANTVAEMAEDRSLEEAWDIRPEDVAAFLETLPDGEFHCAELAVGALYLALSDVQRRRREPWRKLYGS